MANETKKKTTMALDVFESVILPALKGDTAEEKKASLEATLKMIDVVDDQGNPVDISGTLVLAPAGEKEGDEPEEEEKMEDDEDDVEKRIEQVVARKLAGIKAADASLKRISDALNGGARVTGGNTRNDDKGRLGFKHFGEFASSVKRWAVDKDMDARLKAPTTYGTGSVGADGGFLIPPDFRAEIQKHMLEQPSLMSMCKSIQTTGNSIEIPTDNTTPWGSDGVQAYWVNSGNAEQITQSKPKVGLNTVNLHDLAVLIPVTNNMLEDSGIPLEGYLAESAASRLTWKVDNAVLNGTGAGQPLGIRNAPVIKQTSRSATTGINITDVFRLVAAHPGTSLANAAFVTHTTVLPDIGALQVGNYPVFLGPNTAAEANLVAGRLMGRPLVVHEAAQARDNAGDLSLHDFGQYLLVTKSTGIKSDVSIHLFFDYLQTAFRFSMRVGGQPWPSSTISQANGGGTVSPFVEVGAS